MEGRLQYFERKKLEFNEYIHIFYGLWETLRLHSSWWVKEYYWVIVIWPEFSLTIHGERFQGNFTQYNNNHSLDITNTKKLDQNKFERPRLVL